MTGLLTVWFAFAKEVSEEQIREICDNCGVQLLEIFPEFCLVSFDGDVDLFVEKLNAWPEYIRDVCLNYHETTRSGSEL